MLHIKDNLMTIPVALGDDRTMPSTRPYRSTAPLNRVSGNQHKRSSCIFKVELELFLLIIRV